MPGVKIAVMLTFTPSRERVRTAANSGSPRVVVTGSLV